MSTSSSPMVEKYKNDLGECVSQFIAKAVGDGLMPSDGTVSVRIDGDGIGIDVDTRVVPVGSDSNGDMNVALEMAFTITDKRPTDG